ncbi:choline-responsive transcriptional repressor BetI [Kiloniella sp.]|uniref:choline-binding transcriptional repressor BetI n=1 Tax=Kiloniella sp. TaxID=1938587 RepID=UPI003A944C7E
MSNPWCFAISETSQIKVFQMKRRTIVEIRKQELIEASFELLQELGIKGASLSQVAARAGVSKGIVLHYFKSKESLIESTMRYANALLRDEVIELLKTAHSPRERIQAVIDGNFSPKFFKPEIAHAWLALCSEVPHIESFERVQNAIHRRMHSNLVSALREIIPDEDAESLAIGISTFIDGLWLRLGLSMGRINREEALTQINTFVKIHIDKG